MEILAFAVLTGWCAVLSWWDLRQWRLPDPLTGSLALGTLGYAWYAGQFGAGVIGAALLAVPYLLVHLAAPGALGAGDVKLAVGLGAAAGPGGAQVWVWAAVAAPVLTAALGVARLCANRIRRRAGPGASGGVPHGPAMCAATLIALGAAAI
ncbi:prepilin peptidase [Nocardia sp. NPDC127579]|uniref:prepilin peptidase n=1 Tax=Nocardia sp. NPDC127579 TaxID=3345402 RepID=UPI00363DD9E3